MLLVKISKLHYVYFCNIVVLAMLFSCFMAYLVFCFSYFVFVKF